MLTKTCLFCAVFSAFRLLYCSFFASGCKLLIIRYLDMFLCLLDERFGKTTG